MFETPKINKSYNMQPQGFILLGLLQETYELRTQKNRAQVNAARGLDFKGRT